MNDVAIVKEGWLHKRGKSALHRRSRPAWVCLALQCGTGAGVVVVVVGSLLTQQALSESACCV